MRLWEALDIVRKSGGKLRRVDGLTAHWNGVALVIDGSTKVMEIYNTNIDWEWMVIGSPPKQYDFLEAYGMMNAGKWMKPVLQDAPVFKGPFNTRDLMSLRIFSPDMIESPWEEVQS